MSILSMNNRKDTPPKRMRAESNVCLRPSVVGPPEENEEEEQEEKQKQGLIHSG
jgi:hypothetical protein